MSKSPAIFKSWTKTLGAMIDQPGGVMVRCTICGRHKDLTVADLTALAEVKGRDYSLINRRCRCRLTQGCAGWNKFHYLEGVMRPLWDDETSWRWF